MGMTIDEHIKVLKSYCNGFTGQAGNLQESIDVAIETMHKYQEIERIYKEWFSDAGHTSAEAYGRIGEVLKNGNDS